MVPKSIMKMKSAWTLLLLGLLMRVGCAAQQPLRPATAAQLQTFNRLFQQGSQAALRRDVQYLSDNLMPDFTVRASGLVMHRAQYLRYTAALYKRMVKMNSTTFKIEKLGFRGKQAFAIATNTHDFTARDRSGKIRRVKLIDHMNSFWILTSRGWLVQSAVQTSARLFVDGRKVTAR